MNSRIKLKLKEEQKIQEGEKWQEEEKWQKKTKRGENQQSKVESRVTPTLKGLIYLESNRPEILH